MSFSSPCTPYSLAAGLCCQIRRGPLGWKQWEIQPKNNVLIPIEEVLWSLVFAIWSSAKSGLEDFYKEVIVYIFPTQHRSTYFILLPFCGKMAFIFTKFYSESVSLETETYYNSVNKYHNNYTTFKIVYYYSDDHDLGIVGLKVNMIQKQPKTNSLQWNTLCKWWYRGLN